MNVRFQIDSKALVYLDYVVVDVLLAPMFLLHLRGFFILLDDIWRTVLDEITMVLHATPFWQSIRNVHHPFTVEHV